LTSQARILVACHDSELLGQLERVAKSLGHLLLRTAGSDDLHHRLLDLRPEVLVIDADSALVRDKESLDGVVQRIRHAPIRPQILLLARPEDTQRNPLRQRLYADDAIDKPLAAADLELCLRALVRVQRVSAQALRDRDILNALFELSAFSESRWSPDEVLTALAGRVAEWTGLVHVVVTLGPASQPRIAAETHKVLGGYSRALVDRRHAELVAHGQTRMIDEAEGVLAGESPVALPYVGLPLRTHGGDRSSGTVLGVLHAWGKGQGATGKLPTGTQLRVLQVAAQRVSTEIQLHETNRRLELMVEERTADLTAALERLRTVNVQLLEASRDTVMRLARAAEYRDGGTGEHVERMSSYAQVIARQMGLPAEDQALIKLAAPMHDVGKIGIRDSILLKQGRLTPDEYQAMKEHPAIGATILGGSKSKLLQMAEMIAVSHHEKWDGSGYPKGLNGEAIPLVGRIVALADVFDALTTPRVYKDAWSVEDAVGHIRQQAGKHFDPRAVAAFEQCLDQLVEIRARFLEDGGAQRAA
jgi:HD-GYP domain-containing protein (c-di-GMP phosphodiesterase class II)